MALEVEWKMLVLRLPALPGFAPKAIDQGYFDPDGRPSIRARLKGSRGFVTFKMPLAACHTEGAPQTCEEYEWEIPADDARGLLAMSKHRVTKRRYVFPDGLELDVFDGRHAGLVVAELEVPEGTPAPEAPEGWEWREVSSDERYSNRWLAEHGIPPGAESARIG